VPVDKATAFENECRLLDGLMQEFYSAKEENLKAAEALLNAERAARGPGRTIPQHPQVLSQAKQRVEEAEKKLADAQQKVEEAFKPLGELDGTSGKLYELIPIHKRSVPLPAERSADREGLNNPLCRPDCGIVAPAWRRFRAGF